VILPGFGSQMEMDLEYFNSITTLQEEYGMAGDQLPLILPLIGPEASIKIYTIMQATKP